jgi:hypothetical protein
MKKLLILIFLSFQFCPILFAQQSTLSGKIIYGKDNSPIIGATIKIKNTVRGTISDINGQFEIKSTLPVTLVVSYVGLKSLEFIVDNNNKIAIQMGENKTKIVKEKNEAASYSKNIINENKSIETENWEQV